MLEKLIFSQNGTGKRKKKSVNLLYCNKKHTTDDLIGLTVTVPHRGEKTPTKSSDTFFNLKYHVL